MNMIMKPKKIKKLRDDFVFNIVNIVILVMFSLLCLLPILNVVAKSFSHHSAEVTFFPRNFTLYSYKEVIKNFEFLYSFIVSICVTASAVVLSLLILTFASYALSKTDLPFRKAYMIYFIITMLFSGGMVPTFIVMRMYGLVNNPIVLVVPGLVQVYNMILMKNYFEGLPAELEESAKIDGASPLKTLMLVIIPVSIPMVLTIGLFIGVGYWNNYFTALLYMPSNKAFHPLPLYLKTLMTDNSSGDTLMNPERANSAENIVAATIVLSVLPIILIYPFLLKHFTKGLVVGSVKG